MIGWDIYFLQVCQAVAKRSPCLSRQIGAIIVVDKVIVVEGYNGPPRNYPHCKAKQLKSGEWVCPRQGSGYKSGEGLWLCPAQHAERNAISQAARLGIAVKGGKMYMTCGPPCKDCMGAIINAGITEIICTESPFYDRLSKDMVLGGYVKLRYFGSN